MPKIIQKTPSSDENVMIQLKIKKFTAQQKLLLLTGAFIILTVVMIIFIIRPAVQEIYYLNDQVSHYKSELERKYQERFNVRQTIDALENTKKLLPAIETAFIPKDGEIAFVESLEEVADKYGLKQQLGLNANSSSKDGFSTSLSIALTLDGDYKNILKYMEELEKQNIYINFKEILMSQRKTFTTNLKGVVWRLN